MAKVCYGTDVASPVGERGGTAPAVPVGGLRQLAAARKHMACEGAAAPLGNGPAEVAPREIRLTKARGRR